MDLKEALLEEHSKTQSEIISTYIGKSETRFNQLMKLVLGNHELLAGRAAWTMGHCVEYHPDLAKPYLSALVELISKKDINKAITRNTTRILQVADIPRQLVAEVFNLCYNFLNDPDEAAAIRIYSMTVLTRICEKEPDLASEVELLITQHLPYASAGYRARARKAMPVLQRLQSR